MQYFLRVNSIFRREAKRFYFFSLSQSLTSIYALLNPYLPRVPPPRRCGTTSRVRQRTSPLRRSREGWARGKVRRAEVFGRANSVITKHIVVVSVDKRPRDV